MLQALAAARDINLSQQIIQPGERPALFFGVPALPDHFVGRAELVDQVAAQLLAGANPALSADGLPGVGKTTLAVVLAHRRDLLAHFRDGVLWAGLGPQGDPLAQLGRWAGALGLDVSDLPDPARRAGAVKNAIGLRRLLLVIDDAWELDAARLLRRGGPHCCHLLTTRNQELARAFAGPTHTLAVPTLAAGPAFDLLCALAPEACAADPPQAQRLAAAVGGLPLALELVGGYLAAPERTYFADLRHEALTAVSDPAGRLALACQRLGSDGAPVTLEQTLALSLADLPAPAVDAFHALGAFAAKPATFDRPAAEAVSGADGRVLALLISRNLVEWVGEVGGEGDEEVGREGDGEGLALHQVLADFARTRTPPEAIARHRQHYLALVNEDRGDWQRIEALYPQVQWAWQRAPENEQALAYYEQALPIRRQVGDRWGERVTRYNLAMVYVALGNLDAAVAELEQVVAIDEAVGHPDLESDRATLRRVQALRQPRG